MRWLSKTRYKIGFLVPTLLVYVVFIILPIFIAIGYSFTRYSGIGKARFIGLDNYKRLFHDQLFWKSLQNTAIIFVLASVLLLVLSFLLALLLNNKLKFADTSKALVFSPAIIAPIIVGIIWVYILDPKIGVINNILRSIGAGSLAKQWIGGTVLSPYSMAIIYFWQQLGYLTTIFIAGLKMIPGGGSRSGEGRWRERGAACLLRDHPHDAFVHLHGDCADHHRNIQNLRNRAADHRRRSEPYVRDAGHVQLLDDIPKQ